MLDDVACEWHSMVKTQRLISAIGGLGSFINHINLFFGVATGLREENLGAFDDWRLDIKEAIMVVYIANILLEAVKNRLFVW